MVLRQLYHQKAWRAKIFAKIEWKDTVSKDTSKNPTRADSGGMGARTVYLLVSQSRAHTIGVKQAVPYRTGREARYLSVSTEQNQKALCMFSTVLKLSSSQSDSF